MSGDFARMEEIFVKASAVPPSDRAAFLDQACNGDAALKAEILAMLGFDDRPHSILAGASPGTTLRMLAIEELAEEDAAAAALPERIGAYRVLRLLGEGGMGAVYLAQQDNPRRTVALKVMRRGLASPAMVRRFEFEAQVLGRLQHPNIAQVFEAGVHMPDGNARGPGAGGQPFFAMEFIDGRPLTEFAVANHLDVPAKLGLLIKLCLAVQYAHQQGVIHRDLKPANVLVAAGGEPKVLDFGVARATDSDMQVTTMRTDIGQLIGTLPYMSPEQVSGDPKQIDARCDVYALGVIAFEVLGGRLPHEFRTKHIAEAVRVISHEDPLRLSSISRSLRGDLDTIVARALEKDKARRYQSASELAAELQRFLRDEPIIARPPSTLYQFRKFTKRNKAIVAGTLVAVLALVSGTTVAIWQAVRATDSAALANDKTLEARGAQRLAEDRLVAATSAQQDAERKMLLADRTVAFLQGMLAAADPAVAQGRSITVSELIDEAAAKVDDELADQPEAAAAVHRTLGTSYRSLALYAKADHHLSAALELRRKLAPDGDRSVAQSVADLASLRMDQNRFEESRTLLAQSLEMRLQMLGPAHVDTLESRLLQAHLLLEMGDPAEAILLARQAIDEIEAAIGPDDRLAAQGWLALGTGHTRLGHYGESEAALRRAVDIFTARLGPDHTQTALAKRNLAVSLEKQERYAEAEPLLIEALANYRRVMGHSHGSLSTLLNSLAATQRALKKYDEAAASLDEALRIAKDVFGEINTDVALTYNNIGTVASSRADYSAAEQAYRNALRIYEAIHAPDHPDIVMCVNNIGKSLKAQKRVADAKPFFEQSLESRRRTMSPSHPYFSANVMDVAMARFDTGDPAGAEPLLREVVELVKQNDGPDHWRVAASESRLGGCLVALDRGDEAEPLLLSAAENLIRQTTPAAANARLEALRRLIKFYETASRAADAATWKNHLAAFTPPAAPSP